MSSSSSFSTENLPPAVPKHVLNSYSIWFISGTISVVPVAYFTGYQAWIATAHYITLLSDYDAFQGQHEPRTDPIEERSGLATRMLVSGGVPAANILMLLLSTALVIFIGATGRLESSHSHVHVCIPETCSELPPMSGDPLQQLGF